MKSRSLLVDQIITQFAVCFQGMSDACKRELASDIILTVKNGLELTHERTVKLSKISKSELKRRYDELEKEG